MLRRRPLILTSAAAAAALSLLGAGCGGGGSSGVARVAATTTTAASAAADATTTIEYGASGANAQALSFARCMRSHGIANWPDPESNGAFDKSKLRQLDVSPSRVRSIEERSCRDFFQNAASGQGQTITAADRTDYLKAAACMRRHGFADFPDPTFPGNGVELHIPSSIDTNASRFKRAAETCTRLIPAGLPYTRPNGS
jgi:hypothetical protein